MIVDVTAVALFVCCHYESGSSRLVDHLHIGFLDRTGREVARAVVEPRTFRRIERDCGLVAAARAWGGMAITHELGDRTCARADVQDVRTAGAIRLTACVRDHIHIELLGRRGEPFANAVLEFSSSSRFFDSNAIMDAVRAGPVSVPACEIAA
jgi:hypothetical protein